MTTRFRPGPDHGKALRRALGSFGTGVTVIAAPTPEGPVGMTVNSFTSVSLDPALVLWCIDKGSDRFDAFRTAPRYAIHVLAADQAALSNGFAKDPGFFAEAAWSEGADGVPDLDGVLTRFDCRLETAHGAGDHVILIGEVLEVRHREGAPLIFACGGYGGFEAQSSD